MRSIIWDLGGTLLDTYPDVDRALALAAFGDDDAAHRAQVARLTRVSSGRAIAELAQLTGVPEIELRRAYDGVKAYWAHTPAPVMAGAREVMADVTAGGGLNLVATHRDRTSAEQLIEATALAIDDLVCAPDGFARKPSPEMNAALLQRHGLQTHDVLAVGDRTGDVEAAQALGMTAVLLVTPTVPLDAAGAVTISALTELRSMLSASA